VIEVRIVADAIQVRDLSDGNKQLVFVHSQSGHAYTFLMEQNDARKVGDQLAGRGIVVPTPEKA
jgi:hypothetical protein